MKHEVELAGRTLHIEFEQSHDCVKAIIDGRTYQLSLIQPEKGIYSILLNNRIYEFYVEPGLLPDSFTIQLNKQQWPASIIDRQSRTRKTEGAAAGAQAIRSPMPGRVVQIVKAVGESVTAGEGVLIIEAMKMQNEMTAPKSGTVIEIKVSTGQTVAANEILAVIE